MAHDYAAKLATIALSPVQPHPAGEGMVSTVKMRVMAVDDDGREAAGYGRFNHSAGEWVLYADDFPPVRNWTVKGWV